MNKFTKKHSNLLYKKTKKELEEELALKEQTTDILAQADNTPISINDGVVSHFALAEIVATGSVVATDTVATVVAATIPTWAYVAGGVALVGGATAVGGGGSSASPTTPAIPATPIGPTTPTDTTTPAKPIATDVTAPIFTSDSASTPITENSGIGQAVYTAIATDNVAVASYTLGGADADKFTIDNTGKVTLTANPDFETQSSYSFDVIAKDAANNSTTKAVTLNVVDVNENITPVNYAPVFGNYLREVEITSASLNVMLNNVSLEVGKEYSDDGVILKMSSARQGTVMVVSQGISITVNIVNGELIGAFEGTTFKYKLLAGDGDTITLVQTDTQWVDAMNATQYRKGPSEFWTLMSTSEMADVLPTSGEIAWYHYKNMNNYGDLNSYKSIKSVIDFASHTIKSYDIDGNLMYDTTFTTTTNGSIMHFSYGEGSAGYTDVQIMSNINGNIVFKTFDHNEYSLEEGSANGKTTIKDWLNYNGNYLNYLDSNTYVEVIFNSDGTVNCIEVYYNGELNNTYSGAISSDGKTLTVILAERTQLYALNTATNSIDVMTNSNENDFGSTNQLLNYTFVDRPMHVDINENQAGATLIEASDPDGDILLYSIAGGADALLFEMNQNILQFETEPDYENPIDAGADNIYEVDVKVIDGKGGETIQSIEFKVSDVNENTLPSTTSAERISKITNDDGVIIVQFTYDDNGNVGKIKDFNYADNYDEITFAYNSAGYLISSLIDYDADSTIDKRAEFTTDANGHFTEFKGYDSISGALWDKTIYEYDLHGNWTHIIASHYNESYENRNETTSTNTYDGSGRLTQVDMMETLDFEADGIIDYTDNLTLKITYDAVGKIIQEDIFSSHDEHYVDKIFYNDNGLISRVEDTLFEAGVDQGTTVFTYTHEAGSHSTTYDNLFFDPFSALK